MSTEPKESAPPRCAYGERVSTDSRPESQVYLPFGCMHSHTVFIRCAYTQAWQGVPCASTPDAQQIPGHVYKTAHLTLYGTADQHLHAMWETLARPAALNLRHPIRPHRRQAISG